MSKKIIVTGGAGFIGSAVIQELQKFNHDLYIIDNLSFGNREFINIPDEKFFQEDILNKEKMREIFHEIQPDWIIHLAAIHYIPYCNKHPYEISNINIQGTMHLLEIAGELKSLEKFFFASTAAVYPIYDDAIAETRELNPLDIYGLSKLTGEHLCKKFHLETKIPTVVCRFFNAFGPNETNPHLIPEIQIQVNKGSRTIELGNLEPKRDFIHTYDMARAVRMLMEQFKEGYDTFNLGRGIEYSVVEIVEAFARQIGEKIEIVQHPDRIRKTDRLHLLADISKLKAFTGWSPEIEIDGGIATLVQTESEIFYNK